jgi:hypothetical protein
VKRLKKIYDAHVIERFGKDYTKEEEDIESLTMHITKLFKEVVVVVNSMPKKTNEFKENIELFILYNTNKLTTQFKEIQANYSQSIFSITSRIKDCKGTKKEAEQYIP